MSGMFAAPRRAAPSVAAVAALDSMLGFGYRQTALAVGLILLAALGADALQRSRGRRSRSATGRASRRAVLSAAAIAWSLTGLAMLTAPLASVRAFRAATRLVLHPLVHASSATLAQRQVIAPWRARLIL